MRLFLIFLMVESLFFGCAGPDDIGSLSPLEKGDLAFVRRDYLKAAKIWQAAYADNQKDVLLLDRLGRCYLKLGKLAGAKSFFQEAVEIDPDNVDVQIRLAQVYILTGEMSRADKICKTMAGKNIDHPDLDLINADISLVVNRLDAAEHFYRRAVTHSENALRPLMKLAIFLKATGRDGEAREIFELVEKNIIGSSQIYLLKADFHLLDDQYDQAEQSILDAVGIEPRDLSLKYHLIQFYLASEEMLKAETIIKELLEDQDDINLRMMLADVYMLKNELEKAEKIILELKEKTNEFSVEFELLQGKFWFYSGMPVHATSHLRSALDLQPGLVNTQYFLGLAHLINQKVKLSENALVRTLQIRPDHYQALLLMSELLYKKKEYDLSLQYLDRLLKKYPDDFTAHIIKGLNLLETKQYAPAKDQFNQSTHLSHRTHIPYYYLGLAEELTGNGSEALKYYKQALDISPGLIDVAYRYGMLLVKMKKNRAATDFINGKLAAKDKSMEVYYLAAKMALKMGEFLWTETLLKEARLSDSVPGDIFLELADHYQRSHRTRKAVETLKECTERNPYFQDAWLALSRLYVESRQFTEALEIMEQGYGKFKDSPVFQSNFAWILLENGQEVDRALPLARKAYEKMPDSTAFADTLGWAYYHKGIYSQAAWLFSEVEKKDPGNGFVHYHLGMTYYRQGDIDRAKKFLTSALESELSIYYSQNIETVFNELSRKKPDELEIEASSDEDLIFLPPENDTYNDYIVPRWKEQDILKSGG